MFSIPYPLNHRSIRSHERERRTHSHKPHPIKHVKPDGLAEYIFKKAINRPPYVDTTYYPQNIFLEAKAVGKTHLPPSYQHRQIAGFIDTLRHEIAAEKDDKVPPITFMTTSNVPHISFHTRLMATNHDVIVNHSVLFEKKSRHPRVTGTF